MCQKPRLVDGAATRLLWWSFLRRTNGAGLTPFLDVQALSCPEESLTQLPKCLGDAQVSSTRVFMKLPPGVPSHAPWKDPK